MSQQEVLKRNQHILSKHPSLGHLFQQKIVQQNHDDFDGYSDELARKEKEQYEAKKRESALKMHHLRDSRKALFFNHSESGYETTTRCKIYKNEELSELQIEVESGELLGGLNAMKSVTIKGRGKVSVVEIVEPIKGFIDNQYVQVSSSKYVRMNCAVLHIAYCHIVCDLVFHLNLHRNSHWTVLNGNC